MSRHTLLPSMPSCGIWKAVENNLIVRWDSAPHHKELASFPFHKHTGHSAEAHKPMTLLEALDEIVRLLQI